MRRPKLFDAIIKNDDERAELKARDVIPFGEMKRLIREHHDFMRAAEKQLHWNTDKGATA